MIYFEKWSSNGQNGDGGCYYIDIGIRSGINQCICYTYICYWYIWKHAVAHDRLL